MLGNQPPGGSGGTNQQSTVTVGDPTALVRIKGLRTRTRCAVTRVSNVLKDLLIDPAVLSEDLEDNIKILKQKETVLQQQDKDVWALMPITDQSAIDADVDKADQIQDEITLLISKTERKINNLKSTSTSSSTSGSTIITPTVNNNVNNGGALVNNTVPSAAATAANAAFNSAGQGPNFGNPPPGYQFRTQSQLPPLEITKFSGDYAQWEGFFSRFQLAVSRANLSPTEKLSQLESHLAGEAKDSLAGLHVSDASYDEAIRILQKKYDKPGFVKHTHIQNLLHLDPVIDPNDVKGLRRLYTICEVSLRSLESLGVDTSLSGYSVCPAILESLPQEIRVQYSLSGAYDAEFNIEKLMDFLAKQLDARETSARLGSKIKEKTKTKEFKSSNDGPKLASATALQTSVNKPQYDGKFRSQEKFQSQGNFKSQENLRNQNFNQYQNRGSLFCIFCENESHSSTDCHKFSLDEKKRLVNEQGRCYICIKKGHMASNCLSRYKTCKICSGRHNLVICVKNRSNQKIENKESQKNTEVKTMTVASSKVELGSVLLQTAKTTGLNPENSEQQLEVRILLDGGAQASFIREEVAKNLNLPVIGRKSVTVYNFANKTPSEEIREVVKITLESQVEPNKRIEINAIVLPYLCDAIATNEFQHIENLMEKKGLKLCDPPSQAKLGDTNIEILIGGDYYWEMVTGKVERFSKNLVCLETLFGWVIQGPTNTPSATVNNSVVRVGLVNTGKTSDMLKSLWELEAIGIDGNPQNKPLDSEFMETFRETTEFKNDRYHVKLPWSVEKETLSNNLPLAIQRFKPLVQKFKSDHELFVDYKAVIEDQLEKGIIERVVNPKEAENNPGTYYAPPQPVRRKDHPTTKLRVVLDGSSHAKGEPSLNDCLNSGPNLNPDLLLLLLRFRKNVIAITADIEKAFLQVALAEEDRDSVRFLWVREVDGNIDENKFKILNIEGSVLSFSKICV